MEPARPPPVLVVEAGAATVRIPALARSSSLTARLYSDRRAAELDEALIWVQPTAAAWAGTGAEGRDDGMAACMHPGQIVSGALTA